MDYEYVEKYNSDIEWFLNNADLESLRNDRTINVTCGGETRDILFESINFSVDLVNRSAQGGTPEEHARYIAVLINDIPNEPELVGGVTARITKYRVEVKGTDVTVDTTWTGGDDSVNIRCRATDVSKLRRLRIFSMVRCNFRRIFDNLPGLNDYVAEIDLVGKNHTIEFK